MAAEDLAIKNVLTHKGVVFVAIPLVSMYVLLKVFKNRMYAYVLNRISEKIRKSEQITGLKKKLFECIEPGSTIVEVGAGSGANFQFYPEGCTAICVEPKVEFEGYISDSLKKRGEHLKSMRLVKGQGENLSSVVDAATVDYVVSTLVMCSVEDVQKSCSEAYKVLKPGGRFLYFEHVLAPEGHRFVRLYQRFMTYVIIKRIADNCHWDRQPWNEIDSCGFSKVSWRRESVTDASVFAPLKWMLWGQATK